MAETVKIWFDAEGDYLEVRFSEAAGYMRETPDDAVMERVDEQGHLLGFSIMNVSRLAQDHRPLTATLPTRAAGLDGDRVRQGSADSAKSHPRRRSRRESGRCFIVGESGGSSVKRSVHRSS